MTICGQSLGVFKSENNECIGNREKTNLHKIKNVNFFLFHMFGAMTHTSSRIRPYDVIMTNFVTK